MVLTFASPHARFIDFSEGHWGEPKKRVKRGKRKREEEGRREKKEKSKE